MKPKKPTLTLMLTLILSSAGAWGAVLPNDAILDGKTIGEWQAERWQWVLTIPTNQNPNLDPDGSRANVNQPDGPVFFLGGLSQRSSVIVRNFTVPEGKYLFVPLIGVFSDNVDVGPPVFTIEELRDFNRELINLVNELHASIDGVPIPDLFSYRSVTPVFSVEYLSPDNLGSSIYGRPITGVVDPIVAEGYYLMIEPLPPGRHVINFGANVGPPVNLYKDITDIITVVAIPLTQRVGELKLSVEASNLPRNRQQPLLASLKAAEASFHSEEWPAGIGQLGAFQQKVRAQVAPGDRALAENLIDAAQRLIDKANTETR